MKLQRRESLKILLPANWEILDWVEREWEPSKCFVLAKPVSKYDLNTYGLFFVDVHRGESRLELVLTREDVALLRKLLEKVVE